MAIGVSAFISVLKGLLRSSGISKIYSMYSSLKKSKKVIKSASEFSKLYKAADEYGKMKLLSQYGKRTTKKAIRQFAIRKGVNTLFKDLDIDVTVNARPFYKKQLVSLNLSRQQKKLYKAIDKPVVKIINNFFKLNKTTTKIVLSDELKSEGKINRYNASESKVKNETYLNKKDSNWLDEQLVERFAHSPKLTKDFNEIFGDNRNEQPSMLVGISSSWIEWGIYEPFQHMKNYGKLTIKIRNKFRSNRNPSLIYRFGIHTPPFHWKQWEELKKSAHGGTTFWDIYFRAAKIAYNKDKNKDWNLNKKDRLLEKRT